MLNLGFNLSNFNSTTNLQSHSEITLKSGNNEVPLIFHKLNIGIEMFYPQHKETFFTVLNYGRRRFTSSIVSVTAKEYLSSSPVIFRGKITLNKSSKRNILIGKGFLAFNDPDDIDLLFVASCKVDEDLYDSSQLIFYVSRKLLEKDNSKLYKLVKGYIDDHQGEVIFTNNIDKYVFRVFKTPKLRDVAELSIFHKYAIEKAIDLLKIDRSINIPQEEELHLFSQEGETVFTRAGSDTTIVSPGVGSTSFNITVDSQMGTFTYVQHNTDAISTNVTQRDDEDLHPEDNEDIPDEDNHDHYNEEGIQLTEAELEQMEREEELIEEEAEAQLLEEERRNIEPHVLEGINDDEDGEMTPEEIEMAIEIMRIRDELENRTPVEEHPLEDENIQSF